MKMTLDFFKLQCSHDQVAHIDITVAPSYPLWAKASLAKCKRVDREHGGNWHERHWNEKRKDLNAIGFDMAYNGGKAAEYAYAVAWELGLRPRVNQGTFKGTSWDVEELFNRLATDTTTGA